MGFWSQKSGDAGGQGWSLWLPQGVVGKATESLRSPVSALCGSCVGSVGPASAEQRANVSPTLSPNVPPEFLGITHSEFCKGQGLRKMSLTCVQRETLAEELHISILNVIFFLWVEVQGYELQLCCLSSRSPAH